MFRQSSKCCPCFEMHPVYRFASYSHVCACKYVHTTAPGPTPILLGGCFLFTPFPPLFTRGFSRHPLLSRLTYRLFLGIEHSLGDGAHRAESNGLVTPGEALFPLESRPIGLADNRHGR